MKKIKYYQALTRALREEMERDPSVVLFGEDVGPSGGIFAQTRGLHAAFGPLRVRDTPIAENGFVAAAVGAAMTGLRPVVEIGFEDFLTCCMDPLVNQAAKLRYMLGGQVSVPLTLYTFGGGGVNAGPQHSQSLAAWFAHVPGLKVVMPATPGDVLGLTKAAIRDDNPVLVLLGKKLIGTSGEAPDDGEEHLVPIGKAAVLREGTDVTLVAFGQMVPVAVKAAAALAEGGVSADLIDPRTASPLDMDSILASVRRTGRLAVLHEAQGPCGLGSEVVARVTEAAFSALKRPPIRITPPFAPSPFAPSLEKLYLPSVERVAEEVGALAAA
ncbi:alpha-ketoacid dehydrogenase subunit beta [Azospirillum sp.]|uniref:alpha-ketoacid dehydrogenase subunit beta n=1 Tax=Azospirillum sp. TaxID=34012 RepID=UPI003D711EB1